MFGGLPDAAVAGMVQFLRLEDWVALMCVSRDVQKQLLRVLASAPLTVTADCSKRSWKAAVAAAGSWCCSITSVCLHQGSARSLSSLQLLQPHLTLQGFRLDQEGCHAMQLVELLLQHCPSLTHLDLQGCDLPHLGIFQRLVSRTTQAQTSAQQEQCPHPPSHRGLKVLNLTAARLAPGPAPHPPTSATRHANLLKCDATAASSSAAIIVQVTACAGRNWTAQQQLNARAAVNSSSGSSTRLCSAATVQGDSVQQHGASGPAWAGGLQEVQLGCPDGQVDAAWLHLNGAVTSDQVVGLLKDQCQDLQVLDVSRRPFVKDDLLLHLASHAPTQLRVLDVSLTRVTPHGLLQLLQHCRQLRVLKYACRSGDGGLDAELLQQLAAVLPAVQEIDLSLHAQLDDTALAALATHCKALRKARFARSHKITRNGIHTLCDHLPLETLEVVRCRGVAQSFLSGLSKSGLCINGHQGC